MKTDKLLWGNNIASVSAHIKQPPIRTRDEDHREPVGRCSLRPWPAAYHL